MSQVALKTFVDDISTLAIECCLIQKLPSVFDPALIYDLSDGQVARLASEDDASVHERTRNTEKLVVLETALHELKGLDNFRAIAAGKFIPLSQCLRPRPNERCRLVESLIKL